MKKKLNLLIIGTIGIILSGCASKYPVTFDSNPQAASLICNGQNLGYTPITRYYDMKEVKKYSFLDIRDCSAHWVSGISQGYGIIPVQQYPDGVRQTLQRPNGNGYALDAQFALQVQNMNYQRRVAEASENAAYAARKTANANQERNRQLQNINNYLRYGY